MDLEECVNQWARVMPYIFNGVPGPMINPVLESTSQTVSQVAQVVGIDTDNPTQQILARMPALGILIGVREGGISTLKYVEETDKTIKNIIQDFRSN